MILSDETAYERKKVKRHVFFYFLFVAGILVSVVAFGPVLEAPLWYALSITLFLITATGLNYRKVPVSAYLILVYVIALGLFRSYNADLDQVLGTILFASAFATFFWFNSEYYFRSASRFGACINRSSYTLLVDFLIVTSVIQLVLYAVLGVSFFGAAINTRGSGLGAQLTGIFKEPALLASVCASVLMLGIYKFQDMVSTKRQYFRITALIVIILLSASLSGVLLLVAVLFPLILKVKSKAVILAIIVVPGFLFLGDFQFYRIQRELLPAMALVGQDASAGFMDSSSVRLAGEFYFLQQTFEASPLFGLGIGIDSIGGYFRNSSLNFFTEIAIRWGGVGLLLFSAFVIQLAASISGVYNRFRFLLFALCLFFVDAAVAKSLFWAILGLGYNSCRMDAHDES